METLQQITKKSTPPLERPQRMTLAQRLMDGFAERTGIHGGQQRRYLWTDAFAVCNCIALARYENSNGYSALARRLIEQTHRELGQFREDSARYGWLSGPVGTASAEHPTRSGLRIGKPLPERPANEPLERRLEWDRDGQYFHYLTKWMHALDQYARAESAPEYHRHARELAEAAHQAFVYRGPQGQLRMVWKMSSDLSRPLVESMGQHDPIDGFVTTVQLRASASVLDAPGTLDLPDETTQFLAMALGESWVTRDPLGIGGLLLDAVRVEQLIAHDVVNDALLQRLVGSADQGLRAYQRSGELQAPAGRRLAFRELGLAIGLRAVELILQQPAFSGSGRSRNQMVKLLEDYLPVAAEIETFWVDETHRRAESWIEHRDINSVMLATTLVPSGVALLHGLHDVAAAHEGEPG